MWLWCPLKATIWIHNWPQLSHLSGSLPFALSDSSLSSIQIGRIAAKVRLQDDMEELVTLATGAGSLTTRQGQPSGIREHTRYSGQSQIHKPKRATLSQADVLIAYSHLQCQRVPNPRTASNHIKTMEEPRCGGKKKVGRRPQVKTSPVYFSTHLLIA